jgi:predicted RNA-binding protein YlqC (UPF0109 family)
MKELLNYLAENLAVDSAAIRITEGERDNEDGTAETLYQLRVAPSDMGRVIGRQGRTAKDIRILVRSLAARDGKRVGVDILDENE